MNVLFEDDGQLKAGTVLADQDTSLQVEVSTGRRIKVKAANVLLRFASPGPGEALAQAGAIGAELDPQFLWDVSGDDEFTFDGLAREYFGATATAPEQVAVVQLLHASPMYFYKRGKGRYRKAPADALAAALASVERKKREAAQIAAWAGMLGRRELPAELAAKRAMLLYRPDKNTLEWKALAAACEAERMHPVALLAACGAIPSTHDYHYDAFLAQAFPRGVAFPDLPPLPPLPGLPVAEGVRAFSIDDATTVEIDDAFSVRELPGGRTSVGIHIAAPAVSILHGDAYDAVARSRLSTVYMPGRKITMLPDDVVRAFSLAAGEPRPALSLYVELDEQGAPVSHRTAVERVTVAANLALDKVGEAFANPLPSPADPPWTAEMRVLWKLVQRLSDARGKPEISRVDFSFDVDWDATSVVPEPGRARIAPRPRGSPLDKLVSELMIHVNATWGQLLAKAGAAGLYRVQSGGKVKMSTRPGEHQGLGLSHYLWSSSPLRRYADLVNQRQLLAVVAGERPAYAANDAELVAAMADFEATYSQYAEFQERMEHYWCLRWLLQEGVTEAAGTVDREGVVRLDAIPLRVRLADLPPLAQGTAVRVQVLRVDLLEATLEARYAGPVERAMAGTEAAA
ncbi:MAG: RNB domain-containing ribonuclease [Betaproteobacteria bacterium]|nr:RNB domain-containing ribonuclease [Betaproteobacteria bacterium]